MEAKIGYSKNERSTLIAEKKWSKMVDKWDLCLSQFKIMYEGRI